MRSAYQRVRDYPRVEIGAAQATGTVSAAATFSGLIYGKETSDITELTITVVGAPVKVGDTLAIAGTTDYNGLHPIVKVIDATHVVIDVPFVSTQSGTWTMLGASGYFAGFIPNGALAGTNIASMTFVDEAAQNGDPTKADYEAGVTYMFPGIISTMVLTAGNVTLLRYSNNKPQNS